MTDNSDDTIPFEPTIRLDPKKNRSHRYEIYNAAMSQIDWLEDADTDFRYGGQAVVIKVKLKAGLYAALKLFLRDSCLSNNENQKPKALYRELRQFKLPFSSEALLNFYDTSELELRHPETNRKLIYSYILMEWVEHDAIEFCKRNYKDDASLFHEKIVMPLYYFFQKLTTQEIFHRDIKPSNLRVSGKAQNAQIKVLDFGLSKATEEDDKLSEESWQLGVPNIEHSRAGKNGVVGTEKYHTPEMKKEGFSRYSSVQEVGILANCLNEIIDLIGEDFTPTPETKMLIDEMSLNETSRIKIQSRIIPN